MDIVRYWDSSYEELIEAENELNKKLRFLDSRKYRLDFPIWKYLKPGADQLNNTWKKPTYWHISETIITVHKNGEFKGNYDISLHVLANENFAEFTNGTKLNKNVGILKENSKPELLKNELKIKKELETLHSAFNSELARLQTELIFNIEKRAVHVDNYEPHYLGNENGQNTDKMIELTENVLFAYRGIVCGSIYAYEYLLPDYISEAQILDDLRDITDKIVYKCKQYLAIQMAIEHWKSNAGRKKKEFDDKFILNVTNCIEREVVKIGYREFRTVTKKDKRVKYQTIANYLSEELKIHESVKTIKRSVKEALPNIDGLIQKNDHFYKKMDIN